MKRKLLSVFLSLCMMLTLVPGALAAGTEQPTDPTDSGGENGGHRQQRELSEICP